MTRNTLFFISLVGLLGTGIISACLSSQATDVHILTEEVTPKEVWDGRLLLNGDFSIDTSGWDVSYGKLVQSTEDFYSPPGGALVLTNDSSGSLGYGANIGQCIDLRDFLATIPTGEDHPALVIEAAIKTGPKITEVSIQGIFVDDNRCGTGHVDNFERIYLTGDQDWSVVSSSLIVPERARSLHIFINALGVDGSAQLFIDEVKLYSSEPD